MHEFAELNIAFTDVLFITQRVYFVSAAKNPFITNLGEVISALSSLRISLARVKFRKDNLARGPAIIIKSFLIHEIGYI